MTEANTEIEDQVIDLFDNDFQKNDNNIWASFPPSLISTQTWLPLDITIGLFLLYTLFLANLNSQNYYRVNKCRFEIFNA